VKSFWTEEDKMLQGVLGPTALDNYRSAELQGRTAVLAIFASLGGKPFDEAITW
jgi:hypothetical protein